jgi:hypothetical protein
MAPPRKESINPLEIK